MKLRPYQSQLKQDVYNAWDRGYENVLAIAPTGSGKTVLFSDAIKDHDGPSTAIAHRQELVSQISQALARDEVPHKIIGPKNVIRLIVNNHMDEFGKNYINPSSPVAVAGVDTLVRRHNELSRWCKTVTKWVTDEAHHVLTGNKWGNAAGMFPNAIGLGVTATPTRADGKGLGRHADGLFDTMVEGPDMRTLIKMGYLTDYRIFAPRTEDLDLANVTVGNNGDFNQRQMVAAVRRSHIVGDVVKHYLRIAPGKLGITFVPDVQTAKDTAAEYNRRGVPAAVVTAKTPDAERVQILRQFKNRELLQLVNVDLFGEGFDLPAIEVVSMARPTKSYSLYCQQFGRALRIMISEILAGAWDTYTNEQRRAFIAESVKPHAIIIDHVSNIEESQGGHGLPDKIRLWSLDRRERGVRVATADDEIPVRACPECTAVYERIHIVCPFCGYKPEPAERSGPEFVDGDLAELDPYTLAAMRGEVDHVDKDIETIRAECNAKYMPRVGVLTQVKRHAERQNVQEALRASIAWWAGYHRSLGRSDNEIHRRFYFKYKVDILTAQALNSKEALKLAERINTDLGKSIALPKIDTDSEAVQIIKLMPDIVKASEVSELTRLSTGTLALTLKSTGYIKYGIVTINKIREQIYIKKGKIYNNEDIKAFFYKMEFDKLPDVVTANMVSKIVNLYRSHLTKALLNNGFIKYGYKKINGIQHVIYVRKDTPAEHFTHKQIREALQ